METRPPLGAQIATPQTRPSGQQTHVRIPAALDALIDTLIAAIFARIFARLEQLLRLWQSGTLPAPQPRPFQPRPFQPRPFQPGRPHVITAPRPAFTRPRHRPAAPRPVVGCNALGHSATLRPAPLNEARNPHVSVRTAPRPRPAHDPPPPRRPIRRNPPSRRAANPRLFSFRYKI